MTDFSDLIGIPFEYDGRDPKRSLDCYGLIKEIHRRNGIDLPDYRSPSDAPTIAMMMACDLERNLWEEIDPQEGAVALIRIGQFYWHVGTVLPNDQFIHTSLRTGGVCIERLSPWLKRIKGFYRYVGC